MIFVRLGDLNSRLAQSPWGCVPACAWIALRLRGFDPNEMYADLETAKDEAAAFSDVAAVIRKRYRVFARAAVADDLEAALEPVRDSALVLGVDPGKLYGEARGGSHAVFVCAAGIPVEPLPWLRRFPREWLPALRFEPAIQIIDPAPVVPERREWDADHLARAFTGRLLAIPLR